MDVTKKSIGILIDELVTVSQKCWHAQDKMLDDSLSAEDRAAAGRLAQETNHRRNLLIRAIDMELGQGELSPSSKTYHTYFEKK